MKTGKNLAAACVLCAAFAIMNGCAGGGSHVQKRSASVDQVLQSQAAELTGTSAAEAAAGITGETISAAQSGGEMPDASAAGRQESAGGMPPDAPAPAYDGNAVKSMDLPSSEGIDIDLTKMDATMVYSQVYNMMITPEDYVGKTMKMRGMFASSTDPTTQITYYACIIMDATACCAQGIEFTVDGQTDYPAEGAEVTVSGTYEIYEDHGQRYTRLAHATMTTEGK